MGVCRKDKRSLLPPLLKFFKPFNFGKKALKSRNSNFSMDNFLQTRIYIIEYKYAMFLEIKIIVLYIKR